MDVTVDDYKFITTNITGTFQAEIDTSLADNGFFGNIIVGAVSWYQDKLGQPSGYIDPWSKYTGIASSDFALPVAVVDTAGDALDGKVDYTFAVAAWMDNADRQKKVAAIKEQTAKVRGALVSACASSGRPTSRRAATGT